LNTDQRIVIAAQILERAGIADSPEFATAVRGGGNNRTVKIRCRQKNYLLKLYFQSPGTRDRLVSDFTFATFAWRQGIGRVPQPVGASVAEGAALYEFIEGRRLKAEEVDIDAVTQAAQFCAEINEHRSTAAAAQLPIAAEACFSIVDHIDCIDRRVQRLRQIEINQPLGQSADELVRSALLPAWSKVQQILMKVVPNGERTIPLQESARCLSPSDFGFHNALIQPDGRIRFFDFEYAGWDDPVKLICDFFCQPEVPVPIHFFDLLLGRGLGGVAASREELSTRARLLLPAYRIKWCCIILNDFLAGGAERRRHALGSDDEAARRRDQIAKARRMLSLAPIG
jgi:hypothetical protein